MFPEHGDHSRMVHKAEQGCSSMEKWYRVAQKKQRVTSVFGLWMHEAARAHRIDNKCMCLQCLGMRITVGATKQHKKRNHIIPAELRKIIQINAHFNQAPQSLREQRLSTCNIIFQLHFWLPFTPPCRQDFKAQNISTKSGKLGLASHCSGEHQMSAWAHAV